MKKLYFFTVILAAFLMLPKSVWADPDLTSYKLVKSFDFTSATYSEDTYITLGTTQQGTAYDTGNSRQQKIYDVATPEDLNGYIAFQAVASSSSLKGWWIRVSKGGLYCVSNPRSGAVINLKKGYIVAFNCSSTASAAVTFDNADGQPDGNFTYALSSDGKSYYCTMTADGNLGFCGVKNSGYITSIAIYEPTATLYNYTVKYVDESGNEVKTATSGSGLEKASIALGSSEKASFYNSDKTKKYIYKSDDSESKTIASDGSTVVTVTFREAETWNYSIVSMDASSNVLNTVTGSAFEQDAVSVGYPKYCLNGTELLEAGKLSSDGKGYYLDFTLTEDNIAKNVTYSSNGISDIVYYSEAENIDGMTAVTTGNTLVRSSNSASGYAADADVAVTTLAPGSYKLYTSVYSPSSTAISFAITAGDNTMETGSISGSNATDYSAEFTLNASSQLVVKMGGSNTQALDFIYVQKTGDVTSTSVTIPSCGYATYYDSKAEYTVPAGLTAFTVSGVDGQKIVKGTTFEAGSTVPAGTAVILKGDAASSYDLTYTSTGAAAVSSGVLKGYDVDSLTTGGDVYYMLSLNSDGDDSSVGFYYGADDGAAFTSKAHKAYLVLSAADAKEYSFFAIEENVANAIESVAAAEDDADVYNLNGQKVGKGAKLPAGVYIKNNKKIIMK